ncbi:hypothetical protein RZE82_08940 [Mollicutes bacterium LVI A0039]|nr:hypothetical protein RZE82_08940 [Mollicutes bacterium LVI A0039]
MNIKFEKILNRTFEQIKKRWSSMLLNSLISLALTVGVAAAVALPIGLIVGFGISMMTGSGATAVGVILVIIAAILFITLMLLVSFWGMISPFVLADASIDDSQRFFNSLKKVWTKENFKFFFKSVILPMLGVMLIIDILILIVVLTEAILAVVITVIVIIPILILSMYISSYFLMAVYADPDTVIGRQKLSIYTRKQIFIGYLIYAGVTYLLSIPLSFVSYIPIVGIFISMVVSSFVSIGTSQALILEIKAQLEGPNTDNNADQFAGFSNDVAQIKSDSLVVTIANAGAEIKSILKNDTEIMWQADPSYWGRTSPVLFPFVGKLKDDQFSAGGNMIPMTQHGFLRDRRFNLISQTENSVTFEYTSNLADYEIYPCDFTVQITYRVFGSRVTTEYNVINNSSYPMPYQIGAHPAFNVDSVNNLELEFPTQEVTKHYFEGGLQSKTEPTEISTIKLSHELIEENLPCFSDFKVKRLTLKQNGVDFLRFDFETMEYLAVWSPEYKNAKFVCIEPWNGICARQDQVDYLLGNKDGMNILDANSSKVCSYSFEIC